MYENILLPIDRRFEYAVSTINFQRTELVKLHLQIENLRKIATAVMHENLVNNVQYDTTNKPPEILDTRCTRYLQSKDLAYPKTCPICKLSGNCVNKLPS